MIGYHSNRRAPSRAALSQVVPLYQQLLREEKGRANARAAADAGSLLLQQILDERGQTYDEFVWGLIALGQVAA